MSFPMASYMQTLGCSASGCVCVYVCARVHACAYALTFLLTLLIWAWD